MKTLFGVSEYFLAKNAISMTSIQSSSDMLIFGVHIMFNFIVSVIRVCFSITCFDCDLCFAYSNSISYSFTRCCNSAFFMVII